MVIKSSKETDSEFEKSIPKSSKLISSVSLEDVDVELVLGAGISTSVIKALKSMSSIFSKFSKSGIAILSEKSESVFSESVFEKSLIFDISSEVSKDSILFISLKFCVEIFSGITSSVKVSSWFWVSVKISVGTVSLKISVVKISSPDRVGSAISGASFFTQTPYSSSSILWVLSESKSSKFSNSSDIFTPQPCFL